jgi:hypothetical protein
LSPDIDLVALLPLESSGIFGGDLDRFKIVVELNFLVEKLLLRVVAVKVFGFYGSASVMRERRIPTDESDTRMGKNLLLVLRSNILVVDGIARLGIDPTDIALAAFEFPVKVLDVAHHPCHLNATFDGEFSLGFHLPSGSRATPGSELGETGTYDDLVEIDETLQVLQLLEHIVALDLRELVREVGSRSDRDLLV